MKDAVLTLSRCSRISLSVRDNVDVPNSLRVTLVLSSGSPVEFSRVEPSDTQKPLTFSVVKARNASEPKWFLKFHKLRSYWNQEWKGLKSAWLKIAVDQDCFLNLKITYDQAKRARSKKSWEQKRHKVSYIYISAKIRERCPCVMGACPQRQTGVFVDFGALG